MSWKKIILNHRHRNKSKSDSDSASHTSGIFRTSAVSIAKVPPRRARLLTWRLVAVGPKNDGKALEHPWEISKSLYLVHHGLHEKYAGHCMKRKLGEIPHLHNPSTPETVFFGGGVKIDRVEARVSWGIHGAFRHGATPIAGWFSWKIQ